MVGKETCSQSTGAIFFKNTNFSPDLEHVLLLPSILVPSVTWDSPRYFLHRYGFPVFLALAMGTLWLCQHDGTHFLFGYCANFPPYAFTSPYATLNHILSTIPHFSHDARNLVALTRSKGLSVILLPTTAKLVTCPLHSILTQCVFRSLGMASSM